MLDRQNPLVIILLHLIMLTPSDFVVSLLPSDSKFDAIFAYNEVMEIGAISTLEGNGCKVPQDISIIGIDDVLLLRRRVKRESSSLKS
ncbi:substrate-binding domain-containing protein [Aliiglaciecola sp. SL4]|uniref:substrate-binding domain-containing protein n=1 Tax=Aliiglaciecola sp. SL4 TaxID=3239806 RepID=UPI00355B635F